MSKKDMTGKKIAETGLLTALAMVLSYVESLIPFSIAVPGVKLGLANIVVLFALYRLGTAQAFVISFIRVVLVTFLFGNGFALVYSLSGAVLSLCAMLAFMKIGRLSPVGVGVIGGVSHNLGQILCAIVILETRRLIYYLPVLLVSGTAAGIAIGLVAGLLLDRLEAADTGGQR